MNFNSFIVNIVVVVVMECLIGILLPEGKMKGFVMSVMSLFLMCVIVVPLCDMLRNLL